MLPAQGDANARAVAPATAGDDARQVVATGDRSTVVRGIVLDTPSNGDCSITQLVSVCSSTPGEASRISIFMSVFDCHVNRSPVSGRIERMVYHAGKFLSADLDKASEDNERNGLVIDTPDGKFGVVQIAGLIARRIICYKKAGDVVAAGERVGYIKFGSRVDMFLGPEWSIAVTEGQRVSAGSGIIARRK